MSKKYIVENEDGENEMSEGFQSNLNAYWDQNPYMSQVREFDLYGVTVIIVRDVRAGI